MQRDRRSIGSVTFASLLIGALLGLAGVTVSSACSAAYAARVLG